MTITYTNNSRAYIYECIFWNFLIEIYKETGCGNIAIYHTPRKLFLDRSLNKLDAARIVDSYNYIFSTLKEKNNQKHFFIK